MTLESYKDTVCRVLKYVLKVYCCWAKHLSKCLISGMWWSAIGFIYTAAWVAEKWIQAWTLLPCRDGCGTDREGNAKYLETEALKEILKFLLPLPWSAWKPPLAVPGQFQLVMRKIPDHQEALCSWSIPVVSVVKMLVLLQNWLLKKPKCLLSFSTFSHAGRLAKYREAKSNYGFSWLKKSSFLNFSSDLRLS